ncbi:MAG: Nramp family divalent metal transporter [Flavobacteriales bacterium]|nr:Nramp family divalent metal transporter [Flavobacteriales bacterium]
MAGKLSNFLKTLGPGILFASTAIGVSHLVQSTRAGAEYGFELLWLILLTNLLKYPFFEYGSRYANATGTSLIDGYKRIGNWMLWLYFLITIASMFFVTAAVGAVTAGFLDNLFGISTLFDNGDLITIIGLFVICLLILMIGKYNVLDKLIKIIGGTLLISTLLAFVLTLIKGPSEPIAGFETSDVGIGFMIALMGWMPTAIDLSAWNSLWTIERISETGYKPTLKETLLDFNFGYIISALLSVCFVTMGAFLVFGTGKVMPDSSAGFANEVVNLYTITIGNWSYLIIAAAAFSIMFGTSIAVFDGYARSLERASKLLFFSAENSSNKSDSRKLYVISLLILTAGGFIIIWKFGSSLRNLVDLAMTISFLIAPVIAIVNFRLVTGKYISKEATPPLWLQIISWLGILFLIGFSAFYINLNFTKWIEAIF